MAISANSVFEIRTAGNDTNGGGFVTGAAGVDYSQQNTKNTVGNNISTTDAVGNGTTTISTATGTITSDLIGNIIYLQGGSGALAAGWYQVLTTPTGSTFTVDRSVAAGTGITMNIGGAMASIGGASLAGQNIATKYWVQSGTYTINSSSANVAGGRFNRAGFSLIGYQTVRGDYGTSPIMSVSGISSAAGIIDMDGGGFCGNITVDGNGNAALCGFNGSSADIFFRSRAQECTAGGFTLTGASRAVACEATTCTTTAGFNVAAAQLVDCIAFANTIHGFLSSGADTFVRCISYSNTGASTDGFQHLVGGSKTYVNCVTYANGRDGFRFTNNDRVFMENCIAEDNTGTGFNASSTTSPVVLRNCAAFSNGTDFLLGSGVAVFNIDSVTGSASFFTNPGSGDFSLNNNGGGGAAARAAGYPGVFPGGLTTGYIDIGAAQHQDSGGGGSTPFSTVSFG